MIFGWSNYSNAWTNVTPELKEALTYWTPDQFHSFRSMITKAWWKSFFKKQWPLMAAMVVGLAAAFGGAGDGAATMFAVSTMSVGVSLWNFVRALLRDRANLLHTYRQATTPSPRPRTSETKCQPVVTAKQRRLPLKDCQPQRASANLHILFP